MTNSLIKKIGQTAFKISAPLLLGGLSLINSGCTDPKNYYIDGLNIKDGSQGYPVYRWMLGDLYFNSQNDIDILNTKISRIKGRNLEKPYKLSNKTHEDSLIIEKAQRKVDYWLNKIDSIEKAERIKTGLDALE